MRPEMIAVMKNCQICPANFAFTNLNITKLHNQADFALKKFD